MKFSHLPLYRSITDDSSRLYSSPLTSFVSGLLGIVRPHKRPPLQHKSHSTTSVTKSSIISQSRQRFTDSNTSNGLHSASSFACTVWDPHHSLHPHDSDDTSSLSLQTLDSHYSQTKDNNNSSSNGTCVSPSRSNCYLDAFTLAAFHSASSSSSPPPLQFISIKEPHQLQSQRHIQFVDSDMPPPILVDRRPDTEPVMTHELAEQLRPYLPHRYRLAPNWSLLYSIDQHGISLGTLYRLLKVNKGPCLLIIKDSNDEIFGAFLNETLVCGTSYYGTGECFLWKTTKTETENTQPHTVTSSLAPKIKVFPWTGKNEYMILSETNFIAIGGGNGKFGLWLNEDLEKGHSEQCPTFDNEVLALKPEFSCMELEIWGFRI
ncbi:TLD-domain-containing protein [Spinellus fusiger]|nr:TLD-domain-containing protein [Spinellus fusiger]